jgi:ketosteroid isomerase-like protein
MLTEKHLLATLRCMRQEIEDLLSRSAAAWSAGDLDGFMACYEESPATLYLSATRVIRGYEAIRTMYAERFDGAMGSLQIKVLQIEPIEKHHALLVGTYSLGVYNGNCLLVLRNTAGGWRISADHTSSV